MYKIKLNLQIINTKITLNKKFFIFILKKIAFLLKKNFEITIRIVNIKEIIKLNKKYCNKNYATNILSFPLGYIKNNKLINLGDIVICKNIVEFEAKKDKKKLNSH